MKVSVGLMIDLGNSETRYGLIINNDYKTNILSNSWANVGEDYEIPDEYDNAQSTILVHTNDKGKKINYAHGKIVAREYRMSAERPNAQSKKLEQIANKLSLQMLFYSALKDIERETNVGIDNIDVTFKVALLLPPEEQQRDGKAAKEMLLNMSSVEIAHPVKATYKFKVESVKIVPEGLAAFFAVCFKEAMVLNKKTGKEELGLVDREENEQFLTGQNLIIDIGAGTTDFIRIEDSELIASSRATYQKGGNTVEAYLKRTIKTQFGLTNPDMSRVVTEGILTQGLEQKDVTDLVKKAKMDYAKNLKQDIIDYIETQNTDIKNIKGILLTGGGSMPTVDSNGVVKVPAMSDMLITYIKTVAPQLRTINTVGLNPRFMNLEGLKVLYKYMT